MRSALWLTRIAALILTGVVATAARPARQEIADLILRNGKVVTMDPAQPDAQAIAVKGDRIVMVGSNEQIAKLTGPATKTIDLAGRLAIPGFIEGHAHFLGLGESRLNLNFMAVRNWDEVVAMVAEAVTKARPGEWIVGRGWHQEKWDKVPEPNVEGFPTHESLSKISPDNPVVLAHASGHAAFVNRKAMELSEITRRTPNPPGGEILKDKDGNPTGLLRENADELVARRPDRAIDRLIELASQEVLSKGVTTVQDAGSSLQTIDGLRKAAEAGRLPVRLWVMIRDTNEALAKSLPRYRMIGAADNHLTVRAIKVTIDGALGSRGAWLLEPYADVPASTGLNTQSLESLAATARLAMQHDFQLCVHAIGDRANREALNVFERAFKATPGKKDLRWRIEHAQHLSAADIPRFGQLGVIASMQGIHATSDARFVVARLGAKRAEEGAYVWQKLLKSGAVIVNGTDAPVEDVDPVASFYASVSRRLKDGSVFYPDQRMSRMEALKSYTLDAAYGAFEEDQKGSLRPGKLADITVLSKDIMTVPEAEIPSARVAYTIVGGKIRYSNDAR